LLLTLKRIINLSGLTQSHASQISIRILLVTFLDFIGVAVVFPLVELISNKNQSDFFIKYNIYDLSYEHFFFIVISFTLFIFICRTIAVLVTQRFLIKFTLNLQLNLRLKLLSRLASESLDNISTRTSADLIQDSTTIVNHYTVKALLPTLRLFSDIIIAVALLFYLISIAPIISLVIVLVIFFSLRLYSKLGKRRFSEYGITSNQSFNEIIDLVASYVHGLVELMVSKKADYFLSKIARSSSDQINAEANTQFALIAPKYILELVIVSVIIFICSVFILGDFDRYATTGIIVTLSLVAIKLLPALLNAFQLIVNLKYAENSISRLESAFQENKKSMKKPFIDEFQKLELTDVSYKIFDKYIFKDLSFILGKGEHIAICGQSGSGKSSLGEIILGLRTFTAGTVTLNNKKINIAELDLSNVSAYIPQFPILFNGTLSENIFLDDTPVSNERLNELLDKVRLTGRITALNNGAATMIKYDGKNLSGGERQRISVIRALTKKSPIIIFDEITSALDQNDAKIIIREIMAEFANKTLIFITHDEKIANLMDKVIWMDK
jgi:ATP-binding cassette, subfamily B, bacterial PglK